MHERLIKLRDLLEELKDDSFGDQYGIADWVDKSEAVKAQMNRLSKESEFYQSTLKEVERHIFNK